MIKDFESPKLNEKFTEYWNLFIEDVKNRENLKPGHLKQLSLLCDMYVEHDFLSGLILELGYSYESEGRNGSQIKLRPEVQQLNRIRSEIRAYSVMLGLTLVKDTVRTINDKGDSWD